MELAIVEDALVASFLAPVVVSWFGHPAFKKPERARDELRKRRFPPRFNPDTGEWEDWDGTPIGAIEDMLMDTDGDGIADDFDGDGMPDDWD